MQLVACVPQSVKREASKTSMMGVDLHGSLYVKRKIQLKLDVQTDKKLQMLDKIILVQSIRSISTG